MLDRLMGAALSLLLAAAAIYFAVQLIESVASTLFVIAAVVGALCVAGVVVRLLWRRQQLNRW